MQELWYNQERVREVKEEMIKEIFLFIIPYLALALIVYILYVLLCSLFADRILTLNNHITFKQKIFIISMIPLILTCRIIERIRYCKRLTK